jgi:hypothetical protein
MGVVPSLLRLPPLGKDQHHKEMIIFFRDTLKAWVPDHLQFCLACGKYVPKDAQYWEEVLPGERVTRPGRLAWNFSAWTAENFPQVTMTHHCLLWQNNPQDRCCPRCAMYIDSITYYWF